MIPVYDYRISNLNSSIVGAGTISVPNGSNVVTGVGTTFTTQAHVGDMLIVTGSVIGTVASISDNLHLLMNLNYTGSTLSGSSYQLDPLVNVETLVAAWPFAPKPVPKLWQQDFDLGSGLKRGLGGASTLWQFGFVTQAFRDALRVYCPAPNSSAAVWIRTRGLDNATGYLTYAAAMLWPLAEPLETLRRVPFEVTFRALVIL